MQRELAKLVVQNFHEKLTAAMSSFSPFETTLHGSASVYKSPEWKGIEAFVVLICDTKEDRFGVEIAWRLPGRDFPGGARQYAFARTDPPVDGGLRMRLDTLLGTTAVWWELHAAGTAFKKGAKKSPKAESQVEEATADAVKKIVDHACPYFECVEAGRP